MSLEPGTSFGPYRVVSALGRGGMASVYRAHDPGLSRDVALKVLPPEFLHDPSFAERFKQEARVAAQLEHPHVVPVYAFGIDAGCPWMALRLMPGGSLADRLKLGPLPPSRVGAILAEIGSALDFAHARGVVHRDVKPANVLLDETGRAYLADFGIARLLEGSSVATATGLVQGTPAYMSPEQAMGEKAGPAVDVYALAVVAFECLTGRVPFTGTTPVAILMKHVSEPVPEISGAEVASPLAAVLRRGLAKAPGARWPTPGALATAMVQAVQSVPEADRTPAPLPTLPFDGTTPTARPAPAMPVPVAAGGWPGGRRRWLAIGGLLALLVAGSLAAVVWKLVGGGTPRPVPTGAASNTGTPLSTAAAATPTSTPTPMPTPTPTPPASSRPRAGTPAPTAAAHAAPPSPSPRAAARGGPPPASTTPADTTPADTTPASAPPSAPAPAVPATSPYDLAGRYRGQSRPAARLRVYCEARLEPLMFGKTGDKDGEDSVRDLRQAFSRHGVVEVVPSRAQADLVVEVLERGRDPARIGMRKVRVRALQGGESAEFVGQDSALSFNTWSGAASGAARQVEAWLRRRTGSGR